MRTKFLGHNFTNGDDLQTLFSTQSLLLWTTTHWPNVVFMLTNHLRGRPSIPSQWAPSVIKLYATALSGLTGLLFGLNRISLSRGYSACHVVTPLVTWLPSLSRGYPACHVVTQLVTWLPSLSRGYPYCHVVTQLVTWLPSLSRGYPYCHVVIQIVTWLPSLSRGYPACHVATQIVTWLPSNLK